MDEVKGDNGKGSAKMTILGALLMLLGLIAIFSPLVVGISVIRLIGLLVVVGGAMRIFWALRSEGSNILTIIIAALTLVCGIAILANPVIGAGILSIILGIYFIVDGVIEIGIAIKVHPATGWGIVLFSGIVSLVLGAIVWNQFPLSGAWAIGFLIVIKLIFAGLVMATVGTAVRAIGKSGI
jgi:uncharacterized membrane protein HdeD (DUF308 family)